MRAPSTLFALVVALSSSLAAQQSKARFYVAGGLELTPRAGDGLGFSSQAGYFRQFARLGLRAGIAYYERHWSYVYPLPWGNVASHYSTVAATFDITYDLSRTRARPYLIGGGDVYRSSFLGRSDERGTVENVKFGVAPVPGAGLRFPLGTAEAFTELRLHWGSNAAFSGVGLPLTFGIRF